MGDFNSNVSTPGVRFLSMQSFHFLKDLHQLLLLLLLLLLENNVYAGTSDGHVCHFVVEKHNEGGRTKYESRLNAKQSVGLGKKPIEQLAVVVTQRKLLVLCGQRCFPALSLNGN